MNRALSLTIILAAAALGAWAQPAGAGSTLDAILEPLNDDLGALFISLGTDIAPQLMQATLAGDIVGEAAFKGGFPHGSITVPALGVGIGNGIGTVLNSGARDWQFISPLPALIESKLKPGTSSDAYQASRQAAPYPTTAFGLGFGLAGNYEVLVSGLYLPRILTDPILGLMSSQLTGIDPTFSATSVVLKLRKVFLHDSKAYPAMSLALGGVYGRVNLDANIDLTKLNGSPYDVSGIGTLNLTGPLSFESTVYGAGLEFAISKRLPVITPFANVGVWYRHAVVSSKVDLLATIVSTATATVPSTTVTKAMAASPTATDEGMNARIGTGLEIRLFAVLLHFSANLDLEAPLVDISSFSLTGIAANGLSLSTGIRLAL